jgi:hypothetical protein
MTQDQRVSLSESLFQQDSGKNRDEMGCDVTMRVLKIVINAAQTNLQMEYHKRITMWEIEIPLQGKR